MTIHELPVGGQKSIQGYICHVPVEVDTTVNNLLCTLDDMQTISVKLKRKKQHKMTLFTENICPTVVVKALYYLLGTNAIHVTT